jgi:hypothetical protein
VLEATPRLILVQVRWWSVHAVRPLQFNCINNEVRTKELSVPGAVHPHRQTVVPLFQRAGGYLPGIELPVSSIGASRYTARVDQFLQLLVPQP